MIALRKHVLSKYLTSTALYVFTFMIELNDIKVLLFDVWSYLLCQQEHHISLLVCNAMNYALYRYTFVKNICKVCSMIQFQILNHELYPAWSCIFPDLSTVDRNGYKDWLFLVYEDIDKGMVNRLEMGETIYKNKCSLKYNEPEDNMFERCLIPYYKKSFYKRRMEQENEFDQFMKRRRLQ